jgi:hypothetical protein
MLCAPVHRFLRTRRVRDMESEVAVESEGAETAAVLEAEVWTRCFADARTWLFSPRGRPCRSGRGRARSGCARSSRDRRCGDRLRCRRDDHLVVGAAREGPSRALCGHRAWVAELVEEELSSRSSVPRAATTRSAPPSATAEEGAEARWPAGRGAARQRARPMARARWSSRFTGTCRPRSAGAGVLERMLAGVLQPALPGHLGAGGRGGRGYRARGLQVGGVADLHRANLDGRLIDRRIALAGAREGR